MWRCDRYAFDIPLQRVWYREISRNITARAAEIPLPWWTWVDALYRLSKSGFKIN
jgi:hypothetical protein